jgi:mannose-6-phosphate isomerase-like protein (cupin superfamily)
MRRDIFSGMMEPNFLPALIESGKGLTFTMLGTTMRVIASGVETGGRYTVMEQTTPVGWGPPRHIHSREDEIFYILEGTYEVHCGEARRTVSAGACAILPRGVTHGFRNAGSTPGRFLFVIAPGGLENYFIAVSKLSTLPPNPADLTKLAETYGLTLLSPGH